MINGESMATETDRLNHMSAVVSVWERGRPGAGEYAEMSARFTRTFMETMPDLRDTDYGTR
jgi:hypothetical protein